MTDLEAQQIRKIRTNFRLAGLLAGSMILIGTVFYHFVEKLSYLDSFYFSVITLATVGYGDITPKTDIGKLFTAFYVLAGIGIIATFANLLIKRAATNRAQKKSK
ncbi:MAG: potassium channel family protein [Patescibacteria group bacterium]